MAQLWNFLTEENTGIKMANLTNFPNLKNGLRIDKQGVERWWKDGALHRVGKPAVYNPTSGSEWWYENGKPHRIDGPAVVRINLGPNRYRQKPPVEYEYWIDGKYYTNIGEYNFIIFSLYKQKTIDK